MNKELYQGNLFRQTMTIKVVAENLNKLDTLALRDKNNFKQTAQSIEVLRNYTA